MPTVLRVDGFAFGFFSGDHDPPHVHARYGSGFAVIEINTGRVRRSSAMRAPDIRRARALVRANQQTLMTAWLAWDAKRKGTNGLAESH